MKNISKIEDIKILVLNDGNRRWAKKNNLTIRQGYFEMAKKLVFISDELIKKNIKSYYFVACTVENMQRPKDEVIDFLDSYLEIPKISKNKLKIVLHGNLDLLPEDYKKKYLELEENTKNNKDFTLHCLVAWSLYDEILRIFNKLSSKENIDKETLFRTGDIPDKIDLIIRTGNRRRLSSMIPLNSPYAEIYFMDILFPDINSKDLDEALEFFKKQQRTYGF